MGIKAGKDIGAHQVDHEILGVANRSWVKIQIDNIFDSGDTDDSLEDQLNLDSGDT